MITLTDPHGTRYQIAEPQVFLEDEVAVEFLDADDAFRFLAILAQNGFNEAAMRRWIDERALVINPSAKDSEDLLRQLAGHVVTGRVRVLRGGMEQRTTIAGKKGEQTEAETEDEDEDEAPPADEEKTWIKFEIVDDDTGEPVKGVTLKIKLPDGQVVNAKSDASGIIEINDIPSGTCDIERMIDSDTLEVVGIE